MVVKHAKLIVGICCVLVILLCLFVYTHADNGENLPVQTLRIMVEQSQRDKFLEQLQKFAAKHAFSFQTSFYEPDKKTFLVSMSRNDIKILAVAISGTPDKVRISFYNNDIGHPAAKETFDDLINDMNFFISEFPIVTILDK